MPVLDSPYAAARLASVALAVLLAAILGVIAWRCWRHRRVTPEERERRRRAFLVSSGKMGDAALVEIHDDLVFYTYAVRGVEYTASQDVSKLAEKVPADLSNVPSVSVKYDPKNPANSIILAEEWSGLYGSRVG
jgi:hypothetical protein